MAPLANHFLPFNRLSSLFLSLELLLHQEAPHLGPWDGAQRQQSSPFVELAEAREPSSQVLAQRLPIMKPPQPLFLHL